MRTTTRAHLSHQAVARLGERHDGRRCARALRVCDDGRLATLHSRHSRVCGSQVNTDDLRGVARVKLCACGRTGTPRNTRARRNMHLA